MKTKEILIRYTILTWDYKESPDFTAISELCKSGLVHIYEVNTDSDYNAIILSNHELTKTQQKQFFEEWDN